MGNYMNPVFQSAMNEHFDIFDTQTRKVLLAVNEADQNKILLSLTSKLYDNIVEKIDDIDFGDIPYTKGDITKLPNYEKLSNCIDIMRQLVEHFKEDPTPINEIDNALENIKLRKPMFEKAFKLNIEMPVVIYNTMALAIISSISLMISACVEFIKAPTDESYIIALDRVAYVKTKEHLLFNNLKRFNRMCKTEEFDKAMEHIIKQNVKNFTGAGAFLIVGIAAIIGIIMNIIPILRELVYFFYHTRTRIADYFDMQADLLQMNATNIQMNQTRDPQDREKIAKRQFTIASKFRSFANKISIDTKSSEVNAIKSISNDTKKMKITDVVDSIPDSATSSLF